MILLIISYFSDYLITDEYLNNPNQIISTINGIVWVHDAFFNNMNNGAIRISAGPCILIIEDCLFSYCSRSSGDGGAIYLKCQCCESIISRTCGYFCFSGTSGAHGQFSHTETFPDRKNQLFFCSLSYCSPYFHQDRRSSLSLDLGKVLIKNLNSSYNYVYHNSGFRIDTSASINIEFSTFINNYVSQSIIINFFNGGSTFFNSNFKNNSQGLSTFGLIRTYQCVLLINLCIFLENTKTLFHGETSTFKYLFL